MTKKPQKKTEKKDGNENKTGKVDRVIIYDVNDITLLYKCSECEAHFRQPLCEITEVGTAVCPDCDCDCELVEAEVSMQ